MNSSAFVFLTMSSSVYFQRVTTRPNHTGVMSTQPVAEVWVIRRITNTRSGQRAELRCGSKVGRVLHREYRRNQTTATARETPDYGSPLGRPASKRGRCPDAGLAE